MLVLALLSLLACAKALRPQQPLVFEITGQHNSLFVVGSVHLLRPDDLPLPERVLAAYGEAEQLVLELDLPAVAPGRVAREMQRLGSAPRHGSLERALGPEQHNRARELAATIGLELGALDTLEPWLAALTVVNWRLASLGFDPQLGVDALLSARAARDGKPLVGLETLTEQLALFDGLSAATQNALLLQSLEDARDLPQQVDLIVDAWKRGDGAVLERELLASLREEAELYRVLVSERNRRWSEKLAPLLEDERDDYLVVVGALHLLGEDSLIELLRTRGYSVRSF